MRFLRSAMAALPATLLTILLLPGLSLATGQQAAVADRSACIRNSATSLSSAAACGDKGALEYCFSRVPEYVEAGDLERCFVDAGCTQTEAGIEASFILHNCDNGKSAAELRRRGPEPVPGKTPSTLCTKVYRTWELNMTNNISQPRHQKPSPSPPPKPPPPRPPPTGASRPRSNAAPTRRYRRRRAPSNRRARNPARRCRASRRRCRPRCAPRTTSA